MLDNISVSKLMIPLNKFKTVHQDDFFRDSLESLDQNHWGAVFVVDDTMKLKGILTDGDARRALVKNQKPLAMLNVTPISDFMIQNPKSVNLNNNALDSLKMMNSTMILVLPVVDDNKQLVGLVHMQHLLKALLGDLNV